MTLIWKCEFISNSLGFLKTGANGNTSMNMANVEWELKFPQLVS